VVSDPKNLRYSSILGQSGSPVLISGESKAIGVASYGAGSKNTATVFRGKFGNYFSAMSGVMYALDRASPGSEDVNYIRTIGRPEGSMAEETLSDSEAFWITFKNVASVGQRIDNSVLRAGSPFLGQMGNPIAAVAGTALGVMSKLGSDASTDIESVHVSYRQCTARAILAEAAIQTVLMMDAQQANNFTMFDKMQAQYIKTRDFIPKVAKLITPGIVESALRISVKAQAAGEEISTLYPKLPPMNSSLSDGDKRFIEAFVRYSKQGDAHEMSEFLGDIVKAAASAGSPNFGGITRAIGEPEVSVTDMSIHVEILCHRAIIGDAALQGLMAIPPALMVQDDLFHHLVGTVKKIARTVIGVAPVVTKGVMENIKQDE
jgi:hypothetical protein